MVIDSSAEVIPATIDSNDDPTLSYEHMITKEPISVTLTSDNLTWLKGRASGAGLRSVSELLDQIVTAARKSGSARSVVGTIEISAADPYLDRADRAVQTLFNTRCTS